MNTNDLQASAPAKTTSVLDTDINMLFESIDDTGFFVSFSQSINNLEAGQCIYLQLPHNADSVHDNNYDQDTICSCLSVISSKYKDIDLSIMKIIQSSDTSAIEIKPVASVAKSLNENGVLIDNPLTFNVLKHGGDFYAIEDDQVHKYYTNNKAWRLSVEISDLFNQECLEELFLGGY